MKKLLSILLILSGTYTQAKAEIRLPNLFGDNMILQRDAPITLWGWADKQEKISVIFHHKTYQIKADKYGKWKMTMDAMPMGGPYDMEIKGINTITLKNILIGDVWICSGQSNMQWKVNQTPYQEGDTSLIARNQIRLLTVHIDMDYQPKEDIKGGEWQSLSKENILQFSAVAYHFGKYLNQHTDIPIGLISSNLGATAVEAWMSNEALMQFEQFHPEIKPIMKHGKSFAELKNDFEKIKTDWEENHYLKGIGIEEKWYLPETDMADWGEMNIPGVWEKQGLEGHDGAVWFRRAFDLPAGFNGDSMMISLTQLDDYDIAWVNGVKIGESYGRHNHRNYFAKTSILKPKGNVLVVRVFDVGGDGGFTTHTFWANGTIRGKWKYKAGIKIDATKFPKVIMPNATPFSSPGVLYNANIAPLTSLKIKGAIWYQGESNAGRAYEYRELFPALIQDWRNQWNNPNLPFFFVQLANYQAESTEPGDSNWAELREAQSMALELPYTGMACTIDIGEANDIHPRNKVDVGKRLGISAISIGYGEDVVPSGPMYKNMQTEGEKIIINYKHIGGRLITKDKYGYIRGFELAGEDQKFYWAKAQINGNTVEVWCDNVKTPVAVRYAWSNNPGPLDLYNEEGLPAVPFRSDDWEGLTAGKVFDYRPARF